MDLGISGLASGFDWRAFVDQIVQVERAPQRSLLNEQNQLEIRKNAYGTIKTQLAVLQNRLTALKDPALFDSRTGNVSHVGHYTQIVWPTSRRVGCATASNRSKDVLVCRYLPAGNVVGTILR